MTVTVGKFGLCYCVPCYYICLMSVECYYYFPWPFLNTLFCRSLFLRCLLSSCPVGSKSPWPCFPERGSDISCFLTLFTHAPVSSSALPQNDFTPQENSAHSAAPLHSFVRSGADHALPGRVQSPAGARHSREWGSETAQVLDVIPLPVQHDATQHKHFRLGIVHWTGCRDQSGPECG